MTSTTAHMTATINGRYASRASDGAWYVYSWATGEFTGEEFTTRSAAVAALAAR